MRLEKSDVTYELHEQDEWYSGTIREVEESQYADNEPSLKFKVRLDGEEDDAWVFTSQKYSDFPTKLWKLAEAVLGSAPDVLDTEQLIDHRLDLMFKHEERDGRTRERVDRFRPCKTVLETVPASPTPF